MSHHQRKVSTCPTSRGKYAHIPRCEESQHMAHHHRKVSVHTATIGKLAYGHRKVSIWPSPQESQCTYSHHRKVGTHPTTKENLGHILTPEENQHTPTNRANLGNIPPPHNRGKLAHVQPPEEIQCGFHHQRKVSTHLTIGESLEKLAHIPSPAQSKDPSNHQRNERTVKHQKNVSTHTATIGL